MPNSLWMSVATRLVVHTSPRKPYASAPCANSVGNWVRCSAVNFGVGPGGMRTHSASGPPSRARLSHWLTAPSVTPKAWAIARPVQPAWCNAQARSRRHWFTAWRGERSRRAMLPVYPTPPHLYNPAQRSVRAAAAAATGAAAAAGAAAPAGTTTATSAARAAGTGAATGSARARGPAGASGAAARRLAARDRWGVRVASRTDPGQPSPGRKRHVRARAREPARGAVEVLHAAHAAGELRLPARAVHRRGFGRVGPLRMGLTRADDDGAAQQQRRHGQGSERQSFHDEGPPMVQICALRPDSTH